MKKERVLNLVILAMFLVAVWWISNEIEWLPGIEFKPIINRNTGEPVGVLASLVIYGFMFWLFGSLLGSIFLVVYIFTYELLYKGKKDACESSADYKRGWFAFLLGVFVVFIFTIMKMFGLIL